MKKYQVEMMKEGAEIGSRSCRRRLDFRYALLKFRKDCKNFTTIAKILLCKIFASLAKITVHSENFAFRYALYFRYDSKFSLS